MNQLSLSMGIMSLLFGAKPTAATVKVAPTIDLATFMCGRTAIGERPKPDETYAKHFDSNGVANFESSGVELGTKEGVLHYAFITLAIFKGRLLRSGANTSISSQTTIDQIVSLFGEPYWKSTDDDETILFYEFNQGRIELQFEFPGNRILGFITLSRDGVLSVADQRKAYGVTHPWPPK